MRLMISATAVIVSGLLLQHSSAYAQAVGASPLQTENTNIVQVINTRLAKLGDYYLSDSCPAGSVKHHATKKRVESKSPPACQKVMGKLTIAGALTPSRSTATLGTVDIKNIPTSVFAASANYTNCSSVQQSQTLIHTEQLEIGHTATKTSAIQTGSTIQTTISGSINLGYLSIGGSNTRSENQSVTITNASQESATTTQTETVQIPQLVPSMSAVSLTSTFVQYDIPAPFTDTVVVDGPISSNKAGVSRLSDVYPKEDDRTFGFAGVITDTTGINFLTRSAQQTLSDADCAGIDKLVVTTSGNAHSK